ncbi:hypothetical protein OG508_28255 [Streptomyces sp. NBC_01108]|uniref:hypothetical protein n=1 Tax=Streptomyces sp. NBC_01108 TaxID=2903751 RepID=UPI003873A1A1|nr:hypothetical protein OG508_28255 [Streptomyces sp. NBC_01108]
MSADRTPVTGPFRISVDATPTGATLDMTHYLSTFVLALAQAADEDGQSVLDDLQHIAELDRSARHQGIDSHATHERDERVSDLLDELVDGGSVPVYGVQVLRLAEALRVVAAPKAVPSQREAGAA